MILPKDPQRPDPEQQDVLQEDVQHAHLHPAPQQLLVGFSVFFSM